MTALVLGDYDFHKVEHEPAICPGCKKKPDVMPGCAGQSIASRLKELILALCLMLVRHL